MILFDSKPLTQTVKLGSYDPPAGTKRTDWIWEEDCWDAETVKEKLFIEVQQRVHLIWCVGDAILQQT